MSVDFKPDAGQSGVASDPFYEREKGRYSHPIPSREHILKQLKEIGLPLKFLEIANLLGVFKEQEKTALKHRLLAMVRDGQLERNHQKQFMGSQDLPMLTGLIVAHREGFGFLKSDQSEKPLFVAPRQMRKVLHGDKVAARQIGQPNGRSELRILNILTPRDPRFVGICRKNGSEWIIQPYIPFLLPIFTLEGAGTTPIEQKLEDQLVIAEILQRGSYKGLGSAKIIKHLGSSHTQGIETELAIQGHALPVHWPAAVIKEIETILSKAPIDALSADPRRVDLRSTNFVTIDGEDSKDFDDAVYCEPHQNGWKLWVAIADVAHYVPIGCAIDLEARKRGTSVYFPREVIPMLPAALSEDLCSLMPQKDRPALICEMEILPSGECQTFEFYPALIRSKARLTYPQVSAALKEEQSVLLQDHPCLSYLLELLQARIKRREARGALDLTIEESSLIFSESGEVESILSRKRDLAHWLIEEAMILANICAAKQMSSLRLPGIFRTHAAPTENRLERLRPIWQALGIKFPKKINRHQSTLDILKAAQQHPSSEILQLLVLRTLKTATYETKNLGHFGLALKAYTHFTSPIRRYPDLLVHRILKSAWEYSNGQESKKRRRALYSREELLTLAQHCNLTERRADYASRDVLEWLKINMAQRSVGMHLQGVISGFNAQNMFVKLTLLGLEGIIPLSQMTDSVRRLSLDKQCLVSSGGQMKLGQGVSVQIVRALPTERVIELRLIAPFYS